VAIADLWRSESFQANLVPAPWGFLCFTIDSIMFNEFMGLKAI